MRVMLYRCRKCGCLSIADDQAHFSSCPEFGSPDDVDQRVIEPIEFAPLPSEETRQQAIAALVECDERGIFPLAPYAAEQALAELEEAWKP